LRMQHRHRRRSEGSQKLDVKKLGHAGIRCRCAALSALRDAPHLGR
jgi:hypothetical protein